METFRGSYSNHLDWIWKYILLPFIVTRLIWLVIGLFSVNFVPNPTYAHFAERGWFLSPHFLIDLWSRWDAKWYLSIVEQGFVAPADLTHTISNIAFFPLYPGLIKGLTLLVPGSLVSRSLILLIGLLVSNVAFLIGAGLLFWFILQISSRATAEKTLQIYFVFPTSFFFSAFYSESLFFLLAVASLISAYRKQWFLSSLLTSLLALTRPPGFLMIIPIIFLYLTSINWEIRSLKLQALSFFMPFVTLAGYLYSLFPLTGSLIAPVIAQKAWGRIGDSYLDVLWIQIGAPVLDVFKFDAFFLVFFLITSLLLLSKKHLKALGIYSLLMMLMPLLTGSVVSGSRFVLIAFPVFIFWAEVLKENAFKIVRGVLFSLQVLYFLGWVNYYWTA